jgi:DNA repair protein RecN (Recombination protein N)
MLIRLTIQNYALINHLELEPSAGLNVITGETGAGKSIMLGAVGLLLGNRADTKVLWSETEKCVTEGIFDISRYGLKDFFSQENLDFDNQTVIRREINPAGKSRAFVNDTPVTLDTLRNLGSRLMDVHSQHETLELGAKSFQLQLVDAHAANTKTRTEYADLWRRYTAAKNEYERLVAEAGALREEADFVNFQLDELNKADLEPQEQEALESELKIVEHAEDIKLRFNAVISQLEAPEFSVASQLAEIKSKLAPISGYSPAFAKLFERLESVRIELDDITGDLAQEERGIEVDPGRSDTLKERLTLLYQLLQKHRRSTIGELIVLRDELRQKADKTANLDEALAKASVALTEATALLHKKAEALSASRKKTVPSLCSGIIGLLKDLGIPDAQFKIAITAVEPGPSGSDSVEILFSANKGVAARPLAQVASGGEFSRVMFCVKYVMAEKTSLPTLILDEIDSGVSGQIAIELGKMMHQMAGRHQIIAITHLPQIAARGEVHYFVYKDNSSSKTVSLVRRLDGKERVAEIAKMIGGATPSTLALENARELMRQ